MHGTLDRFQWTPSAEARLRALIAEKLSATKAAEDLGVTRNTVIGKANRLGLRFQSESPNNSFSLVNRERKLRQPRLKPTALPPMVPEPNALRLTVSDMIEGGNGVLQADSCRFIVTDDHPMLYCGHPKEVGRYCAHHAHRMKWSSGPKRIPPEVLAERDRRRELAALQSPTDAILGVPLPGYSALERR